MLSSLEVSDRDQAALQRQLDEPDALLVLGERADPKTLEELSQVAFDAVDAEVRLLRHLLVRRRDGVGAASGERPREGDHDLALGFGQPRRTGLVARRRGR